MLDGAIGNRASPPAQLGTMRQQRGWWSETFARLVRHRLSAIALVVFGLLVAGSVLAPLIAPYDRFEMDFSALLQGPSLHHILGTDEGGRDLFSRILWGGRISLGVALFSVLLSSVIGIPWGMFAAYRGGGIDASLMRLCDAIMAFPGLVFALLVVAALGPSVPNLVLTIGLLGFPPYARIARSAVIAERERDYVTAAVAIGTDSWHIAVRHILPNCVAPLVVQISLGAASAILTEAALSFLGLGVQPPDASWASLLKSGYDYLRHSAFYVTFPGLAIFLAVWCLNTLGDGLRDALDPRLRGA